MFSKEFQISTLIAGHFRGQLNQEQQQQLELWLEKSDANRIYFNKLSNDQTLRQKLKKYDGPDKARLWEMTLNKVGNLGENARVVSTKSKTIRLWQKIAVAVSIILVAGILVILNHYAGEGQYQELNAKNDVSAGGHKAYITFSNGKKIDLSSKRSGVVINPGSLTYNDGTDITANNAENITLSTPMGGTYQVILPDGTKCWLNAASAIQFPSTFSKSSKRKVILSGEAYFEVAKDKQHPFVVKSEGQEIEVLGTHFNIKAYAGEPIRTTLLEGSVAVSSLRALAPSLRSGTLKQSTPKTGVTSQARNNETAILRPGEQSNLINGILNVTNANTEEALAWKNGDFIFIDEPLESVMRQVSRWYNVDIVYAPDAPKDFTISGVVSRSRPISAVLERMQGTGKVSFKIEGRKIYVSP